MTKEEIIRKSKLIHGDKFDYSLVADLRRRDKMKIICPTHGEFIQEIGNHLSGRGCRLCDYDIRRKNKKDILNDFNKIHNFKYKYIIDNYKNNKDFIQVICPTHGEFRQQAISHLRGFGCPECGGSRKLTIDEFIDRSRKLHSNFYNYDKSDYINTETPIVITCPIHGDFKLTPHSHLKGSRCPLCSMSIGAKKVYKFLIDNNIEFNMEFIFPDCKHIRALEFDFYLPKYNICIEFDGRQHYEPVSYFGGEDAHKITKIRDQVKNDYCLSKNIKLIRISYTDININKILKKEIFNED